MLLTNLQTLGLINLVLACVLLLSIFIILMPVRKNFLLLRGLLINNSVDRTTKNHIKIYVAVVGFIILQSLFFSFLPYFTTNFIDLFFLIIISSFFVTYYLYILHLYYNLNFLAENATHEIPPSLIPFFVFLKLLAILVRFVSLNLRIFSNVIARHILITTIFFFGFLLCGNGIQTSGLFVILSVAMLLENIITFIQIYILLSLVTFYSVEFE